MTDDFIIIAHRGASGAYPENTLLAFRKALEAGASWLELDVQLSADGALVVIHDETLERTTDGRGTVAGSTLAELRQLDAGHGEKIPLLSEVLDLTAGRATVNIELKGAGTAEPVAQLLEQRKSADLIPADRILASSLYEKELTLFAQVAPGIPLAPVAEQDSPALRRLAEGLNAWSIHLEKSSISKELIAEVQQTGRKLLAYTVNAADELQRFRDWGLDGVFSDFPQGFSSKQGASFHGG